MKKRARAVLFKPIRIGFIDASAKGFCSYYRVVSKRVECDVNKKIGYFFEHYYIWLLEKTQKATSNVKTFLFVFLML